ncbi:dihydrofolate reductase [Candidatus Woesearchaeota archaeon CG10_big_fil_rev_8_21_14_0_10_45_16]|nr:MAG: dihydrofolate reductase [Candidatus Woesearchaeota archaeon CG10_big_fil_rev_8_21_14_0_10_45_16]
MISIIVAMTKDRVIGRDNDLPWHLPEDLKNFKSLTTGNTVIMGRKTYESIPQKFRPLPNRHNIVISRSMPMAEGITVARSVEEAVIKAREIGKEAFIIGGGTIYRQSLPFTDRMYISYVAKDYEGDVRFPKFEEREWIVEREEKFDEFTLVVYTKNGT